MIFNHFDLNEFIHQEIMVKYNIENYFENPLSVGSSTVALMAYDEVSAAINKFKDFGEDFNKNIG